jgi:DNA processing protein
VRLRRDVTGVLAPLIGTELATRAGAREPGGRAYDDEPLWDEFDLPGAAVAERPHGAVSGDEDALWEESGDDRARLAQLLSPSPVSIDELARQSGLPVRTVHMTLLELELVGRIERHGGNAVSIVKAPVP